jgi:hypothetical protein
LKEQRKKETTTINTTASMMWSGILAKIGLLGRFPKDGRKAVCVQDISDDIFYVHGLVFDIYINGGHLNKYFEGKADVNIAQKREQFLPVVKELYGENGRRDLQLLKNSGINEKPTIEMVMSTVGG